jgi:nitrate/TMAO reductase-like tetraheme cytochrome c subunit
MSARGVIGSAVAIWALALGLTVRAHQPVSPPDVAAAPQAQAARTAAPAVPANTDCLACHDDDSAARADGRPVVVKAAAFDKSIHAGLSCVDCHADLAKTTEFPHPENLAKVSCAPCHADAVEQYRLSTHAKARASGTTVAATCVDCHGMHDILPKSDPQSRTYHLNVAATCARCHGNADIIAKGHIPSDVTKAFADSIHGRALSKAGLLVAPTCSDCHGAHAVLNPKDPNSPVAKGHVPATCGKCHEGIKHQFESGIHGQILARGSDGGPACQTCHTAHGIQRTDVPSWQLAVIGQCGTCHTDRIQTFRDTFHGQVTSLGFRTVAGCADCHDAHEILPASDPRSPIAPANLVKTCGKCHKNATANFVKYDPHANKHDSTHYPVLHLASRTMSILLLGVFGFYGLHTSLWFSKEMRVRRQRRSALRGAKLGPRRTKGATRNAAD